MDSSIVNMTSVINAKELFSICKLCGRDIKDILLIGHADYEGNVRNIGAVQQQLCCAPVVVGCDFDFGVHSAHLTFGVASYSSLCYTEGGKEGI